MATPVDTIMTKKMDDISQKLDRQNSLYLAHSDEFKKMIYSFFEQMAIVLENSKLEKMGNNQKKILTNQRKLLKEIEENKKRILVFGDETTIRLFGYFSNLQDYMDNKDYTEEERFLMLFIIRGFLIASLRTGLNFERNDRISSFLMMELNDYYKTIFPLEEEAKKLTKDFAKEIGFNVKW